MSTKKEKAEDAVLSRRISFLLALVGGSCMVIGGVTGGIGIYALAFSEIVLLYPELAGIIGIILPVLTAIASLGGIAVIVGGAFILGARVTTGRLLIMLGTGVGILGIVIGLYSGLAQGWSLAQSASAVFAIYQTVGWIGIFFSILARFYARK